MRRRFLPFGALLMATALLVTACSGSSEPGEIVLLTHDSFALSDGTLEAFTEMTGIAVSVTIGGDAGTTVNQAILTKDNPIADVIFGVDNTFLSRAVDNDIFLPHTAVGIETVNELLRVEDDLATAITFGDVCVNYDIAGLEAIGIDPPTSLADLLELQYADLLVVEDPATSSPGLAFLMATIAEYPDGADYDWKQYWADLFANGASVASSWSEAYSTQFTRAGGDRPLVVSYASSPPAEVLFNELPEAPTGVMTAGCFRQIEFAGVLKGTGQEEAARQLVDFLLSTAVQNDIPLNMFVYPTNTDAILPEIFLEHTTFPDSPVIMDPRTIRDNRERWIEEWTAIARS